MSAEAVQRGRPYVLLLLLTVVIGLVSACGGGSVGTGGRDVNGVVVRSGEPISGVVVTAEATGQEATTGSKGGFAFFDLPRTSPIRLEFRSEHFIVTVDIIDVPDDTKLVSMLCNYDEERGIFMVERTKFLSDDGDEHDGQSIIVSETRD